MKAYDLMDAIGGIDSDFVENAAKDRKKTSPWKKILPAAACAALLLGLWTILPKQAKEPIPAPDPSGEIQREPQTDKNPVSTVPSPEVQGYVDPSPKPTETGTNAVNSPAVPYAPENQFPTNITPMISGYGEMTYDGDLAVNNGGVLLSEPLQAAMEYYGDSVNYHVLVELFHDGVQIPANGELAKRETERLYQMGYTVAIDTITRETEQGKDSVTSFTLLFVTLEQLQAFQPDGGLGYSVMLYDEFFGGSAKEEVSVVYNGSDGAGG